MDLREAVQRFVVNVARIARYIVEVLEATLILIIIGLTLIAMIYIFKDITSLRVESAWNEINLIVTDVLVAIILIELTRSFIISSIGRERFLEGFIELAIIILVREIAIGVLSGNVLAALMASGGVLFLATSLWIIKEKVKKLKEGE
ncbi:MAG: phosphate-starvation-inducible PsiE family protein [Ignisphaera sp.]